MKDRFRPAIRAGAVALLHGWDPIQLFSLSGVEAQLAREVLDTAEELAAERRKNLVKALEVAVQNGVARAFGGK